MFRRKPSENNKLTPVAAVETPGAKSTDMPSKNGSRFARLIVAATFFDNSMVPLDIVTSDKRTQEKQATPFFGN